MVTGVPNKLCNHFPSLGFLTQHYGASPKQSSFSEPDRRLGAETGSYYLTWFASLDSDTSDEYPHAGLWRVVGG
jgi:hypothetical protein